MQVDESEHYLMTKEEAENKIATLTGGRAAEETVFGTITTGASNDIEQATRIARAMVVRYGMSDAFGMVALECQNNPYLAQEGAMTCSSDTAARVDAEVIAIVERAHQRARQILKDNESLLHSLAAHLLERETITGEEFMTLLKEVSAETQAIPA
jgi:cell division protease FtsH